MNFYSFALNPELHQPSGICNLSNIDNSLMKISLIHDSNILDENTINQLLNDSNELDENTINQLLNNTSQNDTSKFSLFLPYGYSNNIKKTNTETNKFYFKNIKESITRKYLNNWSELREFIGYNDIEIDNNEIIMCKKNNNVKVYETHYNALKIWSGMAGIPYSN